MNTAKFGAALVAATLSLVAIQGGTSASAASMQTEMFLDNLSPNVDFLDQSSRFALTNSKSGKVPDFARVQARVQTLAANALDEWREGRKASSGEPLQTGRSAAVDGQAVQVDQRMPLGKEELDSLEGLEGPAFDQEYRAKQREALIQVEADYQGYIAHGDDPVLLAMASRELPKVRQRLTALGRI